MLRFRFGLIALLFVVGTARADEPAKPQWRAVWVDAFNPGIKTPQQVDQLIADVKSLNCNTIIAQVRKRGDSLYRKSLEPFTEDATIPEGFDPLDDLLTKGHKAGLQIHAWVNVNAVWPGTAKPPKDPKHIFNEHGPNADKDNTWLTRDDEGNIKFASGHFTDPGHPGFARHFVNVVRHLVEHYPVDGIHLDFVRYTETAGSLEKGYGAGYNPTSVARFQKAYDLKEQPKRDDPNWKDWRRQQVTHLVRSLRIHLLNENPKIILSAALIPWGGGPANDDEWFKSAPYNRVFQDWHAWRKEGLLDIIIPMNYDREANPAQKQYFDQWVKFETQNKYKSQSIVGVGAYMNTPADTAAQVRRALASNADGVCLYCYSQLNKRKDKTDERLIDEYRRMLVKEAGPNSVVPTFATAAPVPVVGRIAKPTEGAIKGYTSATNPSLILESLAGGPPRVITIYDGEILATDLPAGQYRIAFPDRSYSVNVLNVVAGKVTDFTPSSTVDTPALVPDPDISHVSAKIDLLANGSTKRSITVEDLWKVKRLGAPAISPDGAWCCVEVTSWNLDKDEGMSQLWLLATDGSQQRQLTNSDGKNSGPRWSADGKWIAFTSKRTGDEVAQIYVISPAGGEARRVAKTSFAPSSLKWSSDGKTIYGIGWTWPDCTTKEEHLRREKEIKDAKAKGVVITDGIYRYWDKWLTDGKRPVVFSFDVETGKHRNLLAGTGRHLPPFEPSAADYDVSPDGKELCFVADNVAEFGLDANNDLFALDLTQEKAQARCLTTDNLAHDTSPVYSPDGKSMAFLRQTTKFFYADRNRVMVLDRASNKVSEFCPPGRPLDRSASNPRWLPSDDTHSGPHVIAEVEDSGYVRMGVFSASDPARLLPGGHSDRSLDVAAKNAMTVFLRSSFDKPPQVWVGDPRGTKRRIDTFNDDITSQWQLGKVENVTFDGAGGKKVQMWIVYPPNFDAAKKWPLVQMVHGGPHNAITTDFSYRWNPQLWAAQGWVVAIVNFHGSSGFGQDFTDSITGDMGTKALDDIMKATDWFLAKPWIDGSKLAAAGGSYGGYMMAWMNGHTDKFKAHVCHAGVYNWHSMTASDLVRGRERSLGAPPWGDASKIDGQNAQRFAANFKTPTLVVHGEKDYRVPVTQGFEYYNTLRQKGVPTRLLYFPDENHWVLKAHNSFVWHREVFAWIEKYIGKGPG